MGRKRKSVFVEGCCPVCGCGKVRIVQDGIMRLPLCVKAQTGVLVVDLPVITMCLKNNYFEPSQFHAICNNEECGKDKDGVPHPQEFIITRNQKDGKWRVRVLQETDILERGRHNAKRRQ